MKVASFDVGIKNMAVCIFSIDSSKSSIHINDWRIYNFTDYEFNSDSGNVVKRDSYNASFCTFITEKKVKKQIIKQKCEKKAKYEKLDGCYCEVHAKKICQEKGWLMPKKEYGVSYLKKQTIVKLKEIAQRDFYMDLFSLLPTIKKQELLDKLCELYNLKMLGLCGAEGATKKNISKKQNAGEMDLINMGRIMNFLFRETRELDNIDIVVIENQISPIATRMKTIQGMMAQYFIMCENTFANIENKYTKIEFISSSNKLKGFIERPRKTNELSNTSSLENEKIVKTPNYKANKKDGIDVCYRILNANPELVKWREYFDSFGSKKDDLADCFLQGIYYLKLQNIIKSADDLKINIV